MKNKITRIQFSRLQNVTGADTVLPVSLVDVKGNVLKQGVVSSKVSTDLEYESGDVPVFARLALPNGTIKTQQLTPDNDNHVTHVSFTLDEDTLFPESLRWASARLDHQPQSISPDQLPGIKGAWFQLWVKQPYSLKWQQLDADNCLNHFDILKNAFVLSMRDFPHPCMLIIRLSKRSPQAISLPPHTKKILITLKKNPSDEFTPEIMVEGFNPVAEAIMEFLRRGRLGAIDTLLDPGGELARTLLKQKQFDPVTATAAAYYLLRMRDWERLPLSWLCNLTEWYNKITDGLLILASFKIEKGMAMDDAATLAVNTLTELSRVGMPLFEEAKHIIGDLLVLSKKASIPLDPELRTMFNRLLIPSMSTGLSFGYHAFKPGSPMSRERVMLTDHKENSESMLSIDSPFYEQPIRRAIRRQATHTPNRIGSNKSRIGISRARKSSRVLTLAGSSNRTYFLNSALKNEKK